MKTIVERRDGFVVVFLSMEYPQLCYLGVSKLLADKKKAFCCPPYHPDCDCEHLCIAFLDEGEDWIDEIVDIVWGEEFDPDECDFYYPETLDPGSFGCLKAYVRQCYLNEDEEFLMASLIGGPVFIGERERKSLTKKGYRCALFTCGKQNMILIRD